MGFQPRRFLLIWAVGIFLFFSASGSKLPSYILPILPALALLAGWRLTTLPARTLFWQLVPIGVLAVAALAALPFISSIGRHAGGADRRVQDLGLPLPCWCFWSACGYALWACRRGQPARAVLATGVAALLCTQLLIAGQDELSPSTSAWSHGPASDALSEAGRPVLQRGHLRPDARLLPRSHRDSGRVPRRNGLRPAAGTASWRSRPSREWMEVWKQQPYALAHSPSGRLRAARGRGLPHGV